jgi:hypothetical protein
MKNSFGGAVLTLAWVAGIVVAKGFWATFWSVIIPFVAWYHFVAYLFSVMK